MMPNLMLGDRSLPTNLGWLVKGSSCPATLGSYDAQLDVGGSILTNQLKVGWLKVAARFHNRTIN